LADFESSQGVVETDDGALLIAERRELKQLIDEKVVAYHLPVEGLRFRATRLLRDRDGGLWIGTFDGGLVHVHQGRADLFSQRDGLSGNYIRDLFEDREGNIWVGTDNGLDRFRHTAVTTVSVYQGLSQATPWSLLAARDGSVWVGTLNGLNRLKDGQITIYRNGGRPAKQAPAGMNGGEPMPEPGGAGAANQPGPVGAVREITDGGLPHDLIHSLFEDDRRRIWVSTSGGVAYFENDRFTPVGGIPAGVHAIVGDASGNIWISEEKSLFQVRAGRVVGRFPWAGLGRNTPARSMLTDPVRGGLWLGFRDGTGLAYFKGGTIGAAYSAAEGLGRGMVGNLHLDADGTLWAATEGGLSRLKDGRVHTLTAKNGLPGEGVSWLIEGDDRSFWLYTTRGLARVARPEVEALAAAVEKDKDARGRVRATVFDHSDGVRIHAAPAGFTPQVGKTPDGRVWFLPWDGVSVIDPRRVPFNALPPPVHIEQITADGEAYDALQGLRLPPLVRDLAIDYTALSLTAPEKIRFRYKLEGQDSEWKEVAGERRAHYSNLPPGDYRFRVSACNNSGVWNEEGASLDFAIAPAYYQTNWFRALCVAAFLALLLGLYQWRIRQVRRHEKQLRAVVEGMPTMAFSVRPDGSPEFVSKRWLTYSGLSTDATADGRGWEATIHPEDVEVQLRKWRAALETGEPFENEARHRGAGGEYRWFLVRALPFRNKQGKIVKWYGIITDIEDRKRADELLRASLREKEALLKEVHHRVKNNLQLISSLLNLQADKVRDPHVRELLTDSRDRVRSMSLVHENIYQAGSFVGVTLARHLETLCTHLIHGYTGGGWRIELQTRLADVTLDLDRAVPLMLIVNELVSNALKHAFPSDRAGRVSVELLSLPGARYSVVVTDDGVGLPPDFDPRRVSSMGLQLVADLTEQLDGTIAVRSDGGTTFTLTFDAARGTDRQP
jgi:PAS domain S-box-containing protein